MMNVRQVLESGASGAFAIANPEQEHFVDTAARGIRDPSQALTKKRYAWLDKYFDKGSQRIKRTKDQINSSAAHASIVNADSVFRVADSGDQINAPFFDIENEYFVKTDLCLIAGVAICLMDLSYGVNKERNVIEFRARFPDTIGRMAEDITPN